jgi:hypothetical protein
MTQEIRLLKVPSKNGTYRFEARSGDRVFDVVGKKISGKFEWSCTCGEQLCDHVILARRKTFGDRKQRVDREQKRLFYSESFKPAAVD